jgi:triosephosphate isomerase
MLRPLIAGNWKMNNKIAQGVELVMKLREFVKTERHIDVVIAPPFTALHHLGFLIADTPIKLAAQNMHHDKNGAYTGDLSGEMLRDVGCEYVILGHSERRRCHCETDETVNNKLKAALRDELKPIVCVGENLEEREAGDAIKIIKKQVSGTLKGLGPGMVKHLAIAYEPLWAIGTGKTATPTEAEEVHNAIRELLYEMFGSDAASNIRIIYGGSVTPENIDALMAQANIDGALVGGASLNAESFARIINFKEPRP